MRKMMIFLFVLLLSGCGSESSVTCTYRIEQNEDAYDLMNIELVSKGDKIVKIIDRSEYKYSDDMVEAYNAAIDILNDYKKCPGYGNMGCSKYNEFEFNYDNGLIKTEEIIDIKSAVFNNELELAFGIKLEDGAYLSKNEAIKFYTDKGYSCK